MGSLGRESSTLSSSPWGASALSSGAPWSGPSLSSHAAEGTPWPGARWAGRRCPGEGYPEARWPGEGGCEARAELGCCCCRCAVGAPSADERGLPSLPSRLGTSCSQSGGAPARMRPCVSLSSMANSPLAPSSAAVPRKISLPVRGSLTLTITSSGVAPGTTVVRPLTSILFASRGCAGRGTLSSTGPSPVGAGTRASSSLASSGRRNCLPSSTLVPLAVTRTVYVPRISRTRSPGCVAVIAPL